MQTMVRSLNWLYKLPDEKISQLLVEAALDPAMAKRLMARPSAANMQAISYGLKEKMKSGAVGTGTGLLGESAL